MTKENVTNNNNHNDSFKKELIIQNKEINICKDIKDSKEELKESHISKKHPKEINHIKECYPFLNGVNYII